MNTTLRFNPLLRLLLLILPATYCGCEKEFSESASAIPATNKNTIRPETPLNDPASSAKVEFKKLPANQIKNISIEQIDQWLDIEINTAKNLYFLHHKIHTSKCNKSWSKHEIRNARDWPQKGSRTRLNFYTRDNIVKVIFIYVEEIFCPGGTRDECKEEHSNGGHIVKNTKECMWPRSEKPCEPEIEDVRNGNRLNALEPLSQVIQKCKENLFNEKPIEYQCSDFHISMLNTYGFKRSLIRPHTEVSFRRILSLFKLPSTPLFVQHHGGMVGEDPYLIIYRDRDSLLRFFTEAQEAIASEDKEYHINNWNRKGFFGCITKM